MPADLATPHSAGSRGGGAEPVRWRRLSEGHSFKWDGIRVCRLATPHSTGSRRRRKCPWQALSGREELRTMHDREGAEAGRVAAPSGPHSGGAEAARDPRCGTAHSHPSCARTTLDRHSGPSGPRAAAAKRPNGAAFNGATRAASQRGFSRARSAPQPHAQRTRAGRERRPRLRAGAWMSSSSRASLLQVGDRLEVSPRIVRTRAFGRLRVAQRQ